MMNRSVFKKTRRSDRLRERNQGKRFRRAVRQERAKKLEVEYLARLKNREIELAQEEAEKISEYANNEVSSVVESE